MKIRDFALSWLLGTIVFIAGKTFGFSMIEILLMSGLVGAIQGALTVLAREKNDGKN